MQHVRCIIDLDVREYGSKHDEKLYAEIQRHYYKSATIVSFNILYAYLISHGTIPVR